MTSEDEKIVHESYTEFMQLQVYRAVFGAHWEEVAEIVLPTSRNTFFYGNYNFPGQKKTDRQVDATAMMALSRFGAILDSLLTPRNMTWHMLAADNDYLMKNRQVRLYFEQVTKILFKERYKPITNFSSQNQLQYQSLGAFGTGCHYIDPYYGHDGASGLRYKHLPIGEIFLSENHQGLIDRFCRWFRLTPRQAVQKFDPATLPEGILKAAEQHSETPYEFLHRVCPRDDYEPGRIGPKGMTYASYFLSLTPERRLLRARHWPEGQMQSGYYSFPCAISRYEQTPGEIYGRSPAMMVLPAIKTLNSEKKDFLTQGHRAVAPVLLTADDGLVDISLRPGAINKGGVNADGRPLIQPLPVGNIATSKEMMDEERALINDAFLVTLFQILTETPTMTATEVVERTNEKGILLAPTVGRQQSEYLGPLIDRELDVLSWLGKLPPMPPILHEARGEYQVVYTSPLSRAMRAQEVAGFGRSLELALQVVNATQDPSVLDIYDFDTALKESSDIQAVPVRWMASDDQIAAKRQNRQQIMQRQQNIQAAPANAAMLKANVAAHEAGMTPQQQQQAPQA